MATLPEQTVDGGIPPRLQQVVESIPELDQRPRFDLFFRAAATAIDVLGDLEISQYESENPEVLASDLLLAVEPTIAETLNSINAFLECVRSLFAVEIRAADTFDEMLETAFVDLEHQVAEASQQGSQNEWSAVENVTRVLQSICDGLGHEITRFQKGVNDPSFARDKWLLLDYVAMFRGKFRSGVGAMLFLAARTFDDVRRDEVIPLYAADVESSVHLRMGIAHLRDRLRTYATMFDSERHGAALRAGIARLSDELRNFQRSVAFAHMRAADKRALLQAAQDFIDLLSAPTVLRADVMRKVDGLTTFLESLSVVSRREVLMIHDAEALQMVRKKLGDALISARLDRRDLATNEIRASLWWTSRLFGRDQRLDSTHRLLSRVDLDQLTCEDVTAIADLVNEALSTDEQPTRASSGSRSSSVPPRMPRLATNQP